MNAKLPPSSGILSRLYDAISIADQLKHEIPPASNLTRIASFARELASIATRLRHLNLDLSASLVEDLAVRVRAIEIIEDESQASRMATLQLKFIQLVTAYPEIRIAFLLETFKSCARRVFFDLRASRKTYGSDVPTSSAAKKDSLHRLFAIRSRLATLRLKLRQAKMDREENRDITQ